MDILLCRKKKFFIASLLAFGTCLLMVMLPDTAISSARNGITLWYADVLPALLPFFICTNFLQNAGVVNHIKSGIFPFLMSVISGYPMGAKIVGDMRRNKEISINEAKRLMSFCSTSGPAFMISAVGLGMLGSSAAGVLIAVSHYLGSILNGLIYSLLLGKDKKEISKRFEEEDKSMQEIMTEAIISSLKSMGIILAYIVLFMFLTEFIELCGLLNHINIPEIRAFAIGIPEMTVGCNSVAGLTDTAMNIKCILCSFLISWGGVSVLGQTMSMLSGTGISAGYVVMTKITHGIFSASAAFLISSFVVI